MRKSDSDCEKTLEKASTTENSVLVLFFTLRSSFKFVYIDQRAIVTTVIFTFAIDLVLFFEKNYLK